MRVDSLIKFACSITLVSRAEQLILGQLDEAISYQIN